MSLTDSGVEDAKVEIIRKKVFQKIKETTKLISAIKLSFSSITKQEAAILVKIGKSFPDYKKAASSIMELAKISRMLAIPYIDNVQAKYKNLYSHIVELIDFETSFAQNTYNDTVKNSKKNQRILTLIVVFAILFSLAATIVISKAIAGL